MPDDAAKNEAQFDELLLQIRREPPIQIASDFKTVPECKAAITLLDFGQFQLASWLIEQSCWNPRVRGALETRLNGLVGTDIRWEPGRNNELARRAARDIVEDWPLIATAPTRKQVAKWGILLGVAFAQKHWYVSPTTGRAIPRVEHYHPQWSLWDWYKFAYRVHTLDGWALVPSPSLMVPGQTWAPLTGVATGEQADSLRRWVVHEPFGQHSWREGLIHAAFDSVFGHNAARRDMNRASEKQGPGIIKLKYPKTKDATALNLLMQKLRRLGSEGVIPVEQFAAEEGGGGYDVEPFEWQSTGVDIIHRTKDSIAIDLAILLLGHNLTSEIKGGSFAAANVANTIRDDIRADDAQNEWSTFYLQVLRDWAEVNYGDPSVAPIPIYVVDPPAANQAASQTLLNITLAVEKLRAVAPGVDFDELLTRFRVPLTKGGARVVVLAPLRTTANDNTTPPPPANAAPADAAPPSDANAKQTQRSNDGKSADAKVTLALTSTDLATIVKVDEGRTSVGLDPVGGEDGGRYVAEHAALLRAQLPGENGAPPATPPTSTEPQPDPAPAAPPEK